MSDQIPRPIPKWAWILSILFFPAGMFVAYGSAHLLPWRRSLLLAVTSYLFVIGFAWTMGFAERNFGELGGAVVMFAGVIAYVAWGYVLYRIGHDADYWSESGLRGWRVARRIAVFGVVLNLVNILIQVLVFLHHRSTPGN